MKIFIAKHKYWFIFILIALLGILSKIINIDIEFINKYLRDILYCAVFYFLARNFFSDKDSFFLSFVICIFLEILQLIGIPQELLSSGNKYIQILAKFIGTNFSLNDVLMYFIGAVSSFVLDKFVLQKNSKSWE